VIQFSYTSPIARKYSVEIKEALLMTSHSVTLPDDFACIDELLRACEAVDALDLTVHRQALQEHQTTERFQVWFDDSGNVQGFARLHFNEVEGLTEGRYWYYLRPTIIGQGIETSALQWAEQETLQQRTGSACRLFTTSRADHPARFHFLEANDFTRERYFFTMKRALHETPPAPEVPSGYTIRAATLADIESFTDLHNLAFREHWKSLPITSDELRAEKLDPEYRPEIDLLAVAPDGTLASFCTATIEPTKREGIDEIVGFIGGLGTHPSHRGLGLGRALLLHNLRTLHALGMYKAYISVDAANPTGAVRLYESVGFQTFETWLSYFKSL
jgi:mycothiol synthase